MVRSARGKVILVSALTKSVRHARGYETDGSSGSTKGFPVRDVVHCRHPPGLARPLRAFTPTRWGPGRHLTTIRTATQLPFSIGIFDTNPGIRHCDHFSPGTPCTIA